MNSSVDNIFLAQIEENKGILYKIARMYTDNTLDREDLLQEMMANLWNSYGSFSGKSKFSTWLYRVAINTAITYIKKQQRQSNIIYKDELPTTAADDDGGKHQSHQMEVFYQAVQQLSQVEKAIIFFYMEDLSHKEIATQMGITETNARVKLNRTKEKLKSIIQQLGYEH